MTLKYRLFLLTFTLFVGGQNIFAHDHDSFAIRLTKGTTGALIGGGVCYLLSSLCNSEMITTHQNKMKFLQDLKLYIDSAEYREQRADSRLFTHYYTLLKELIQITPDLDISLLQDFAQYRDEKSASDLASKIERLETQLQMSHEKNLWLSKVAFTAIGAIMGGFMASSESDCGCSHGHYMPVPGTYVGIS